MGQLLGGLRAEQEAGEDLVHANRELRRVLEWIAELPVDPRPDGTFNYSRAAIIDRAKEALNG